MPMTLEQRGYEIFGNGYVKRINGFRIDLFPINQKQFTRRITQDGRLLDVRKVEMSNLESGVIFEKILKDRQLNTHVPLEAKEISQVAEFKGKITLEDEVKLNENN